jgi:exosortase/archaeosortase family protein
MVSPGKRRRIDVRGGRRRPAAEEVKVLPCERSVWPGSAVFLARFLVTAAVLYALLRMTGLFGPYLVWSTHSTAFLLRLFGVSASVHGTVIRTPEFAMTILQGCDGIEPTLLFVAAVLASPARRRRRWIGMVGGVLALQVANAIRLLSLYYVGVHWPAHFETVHLAYWQPLFLAITFGLWLGWSVWALPSEDTRSCEPGSSV